MTTAVNPGTTASAANQNIASAQQSLAGDQQTFLTLLTAQLKNQDPTSPLDPNQFTQQLVVMTGVQQQLLTNQLLQQMLTNQGVGSAVGMIGQTVNTSTAAGLLQNGQSNWTYNLNGDSKDVTLQVVDASGNVVYSQDAGALATGSHTFSWNGKGLDGVQRADGQTYGLQVVAKDAQGGAVSAQVFHKGVVTAVEQQNGQTLVDVDGLQIPLSAVTSVGAA